MQNVFYAVHVNLSIFKHVFLQQFKKVLTDQNLISTFSKILMLIPYSLITLFTKSLNILFVKAKPIGT